MRPPDEISTLLYVAIQPCNVEIHEDSKEPAYSNDKEATAEEESSPAWHAYAAGRAWLPLVRPPNVTLTTLLTPGSCIVTPYMMSACSMVRFE